MNKRSDSNLEKDKSYTVNIEDLIQEIHETEAIELPGFMEKEQQERIEARIMAGILELQEKEENNNAVISGHKKRSKKKFLVLGLAAIMLLALCITAFASSNPDWDIEILQFMGLDDSDTFQLDSGEVKIQVYDSYIATEYDAEGNSSKKEVRIMAASSIGDKNSACIKIETDYAFPEGFNEETDYIMPKNSSIRVYRKPDKLIETSMGSTMGYVNDDGKLGYMIYIVGCEELNKSQVKLSFKDFYLWHDLGMEEGGRDEELLLEGEWEVTWKYAYKSNTHAYKMLKPIEIKGEKYYIYQIEMSPLSVQVKGFRMPWDRKKGYKQEFTIDKINYKDGTCLEVEGFTTAGNRDGIWLDSFLGTTEMETTIDVEKVKSIVIGGNEIKLK